MKKHVYVYKGRTMKVFRFTTALTMLMHTFFAFSCLSMRASKNVLASFDVSNAFLNAELSDEVTILTQPAPELVQFGLVKPGTLYQCTKACYGLREAPKLWEESRDKTLMAFHFVMDGDTYSLRQSVYHPSSWFVVRAPCLSYTSTSCPTTG